VKNPLFAIEVIAAPVLIQRWDVRAGNGRPGQPERRQVMGLSTCLRAGVPGRSVLMHIRYELFYAIFGDWRIIKPKRVERYVYELACARIGDSKIGCGIIRKDSSTA